MNTVICLPQWGEGWGWIRIGCTPWSGTVCIYCSLAGRLWCPSNLQSCTRDRACCWAWARSGVANRGMWEHCCRVKLARLCCCLHPPAGSSVRLESDQDPGTVLGLQGRVLHRADLQVWVPCWDLSDSVFLGYCGRGKKDISVKSSMWPTSLVRLHLIEWTSGGVHMSIAFVNAFASLY